MKKHVDYHSITVNQENFVVKNFLSLAVLTKIKTNKKFLLGLALAMIMKVMKIRCIKIFCVTKILTVEIFQVYSIYTYKAEKLSVCLSVRHAVYSPGTTDMDISTA